MSSPGWRGALKTPDKLVGDVERRTGAQESCGLAESLSLSRTGLAHVVDWLLKTSTLQVGVVRQVTPTMLHFVLFTAESMITHASLQIHTKSDF